MEDAWLLTASCCPSKLELPSELVILNTTDSIVSATLHLG